MTTSGKQRVAVLGGGVGALAAVYQLTQQPNWQDRFDITVHQLGWRLGGKGASGRNAQFHDRIEEHGLHVWAGFYENAFRMMNGIYKAYVRPGSPIKSIREAFIKQSHVCLAEFYNGQWLNRGIYYEPNDQWPGEGPDAPPTLLQYLILILERLKTIHAELPSDLRARMPEAPPEIPEHIVSAIPDAPPLSSMEHGDALLHYAHALALAGHQVADLAQTAASVGWFLARYRSDFIAGIEDAVDWSDTELRRALISIDLCRCVAAAMVFDGVLTEGFAVVDKYDLIELLQRHHPLDITIKSTLVVSGYDYTFAYEGGDRNKPRLSAASALEAFFRMMFTYKGALFFKMAAGAGDIIFAPAYEVLKSKGVKFQFFHRVEELIPKDGRIEQIQISVQAQPIAPDYDPLIDVNGMACWPSTPRYELLTNGPVLKDEQIDLEDPDVHYSIGEPTTLSRGVDFDAVILGIPPGALGTICANLATPGSRWKRMLDNVATVSTQALQLWSDCRLADFGGPFVETQTPADAVGPTCTGFEPPFDTWSDMSHLLEQESWGPAGPRNIAYFCAVLADPAEPPPGDPLPGATALVRSNAVDWLNKKIGGIWPNAADAQGFRWALLRAGTNKVGEKRLDDQYWRANVSGSERYVLSLPGTLEDRLPPSPTEYANLYLAGDWVRVASFNAGCMEVAVMSGFAAATALAGSGDGGSA